MGGGNFKTLADIIAIIKVQPRKFDILPRFSTLERNFFPFINIYREMCDVENFSFE